MTNKRQDAKPFPLFDVLRDLAILRASDVDLASVLPSTKDSNPSPVLDDTVAESLEFINSSRAVLRIHDGDAVGKQGNKVDELRNTLESLATVLKDREQ